MEQKIKGVRESLEEIEFLISRAKQEHFKTVKGNRASAVRLRSILSKIGHIQKDARRELMEQINAMPRQQKK
jgi:hypothetical protein